MSFRSTPANIATRITFESTIEPYWYNAVPVYYFIAYYNITKVEMSLQSRSLTTCHVVFAHSSEYFWHGIMRTISSFTMVFTNEDSWWLWLPSIFERAQYCCHYNVYIVSGTVCQFNWISCIRFLVFLAKLWILYGYNKIRS